MALAKLGEADKAYELFSMTNPIHHGMTPEVYGSNLMS
jgi:cyclic beta-1,2-glucan synthetase